MRRYDHEDGSEPVDWKKIWRIVPVYRLGEWRWALQVADRVGGATQYATAAILSDDGERVMPERVGLSFPVEGLMRLLDHYGKAIFPPT